MKANPKWVACEGEAHSNAFIDNCSRCMPYDWGWLPRCPGCDCWLERARTFSFCSNVQCTHYDVRFNTKREEADGSEG